jgi:hypothetical protein
LRRKPPVDGRELWNTHSARTSNPSNYPISFELMEVLPDALGLLPGIYPDT